MITSSTSCRAQRAGRSSRAPSTGTPRGAGELAPSAETAPTMSMASQCCTRIVSITSAAAAFVPTTRTRRRGYAPISERLPSRHMKTNAALSPANTTKIERGKTRSCAKK